MFLVRPNIIKLTWPKSCSPLGYINRMSDTSTMKKPVLYGDEISPPVRFVMITGAILGVDFDFHQIDLFRGEHRTEFYKKINPLQKVPAISIDGEIICDSHAISLYLCRRAERQNLYPEDNMPRAKVDQMLYFNATTLFPIDSAIYTEYFAGNQRVNETKVAKWYAAVDHLEFHLNRHKWLAGDKMQLCDICCAMTLSSLGVLLPPLERHDKVKDWLLNLHSLPCFEINVRGLNRLRYCLEKLGSAADKSE